MKKIIITIGLLTFTAIAACAFTMPRWSYFPIKVYIPEHPKAQLIKSALNDWQAKSGGIISFKESKSKISSSLVFDIKESCSQIGSTDIHSATTYLFKVDVIMCESVPDKTITDEIFKSAALHEIGNALALIPTQTEENITSNDFYGLEIYPQELTDEDIQALNHTYKENPMKSNIKKKKENNSL